MPPKYVMPDIEAAPLRPRTQEREQVLGPDTEVVVIHRGGPPIKDMWDSQEYVIPPGIHKMPYALAQHFKRRAIVPGTRDPHQGKAVSQLAIIGIDREQNCQPFTEEEMKRFEFTEGLDRSLYEQLSKRHVQLVPTSEGLSAALGRDDIGSGGVSGDEDTDGDTGEAFHDQKTGTDRNDTGPSTAGLRPDPKPRKK